MRAEHTPGGGAEDQGAETGACGVWPQVGEMGRGLEPRGL